MNHTEAAILIFVIAILVIGLNNAVIAYQNNVVMKDQVDTLIQNQQKMLVTAYLATSSNNLLIQNQKQFVPAIPTIHNSLAHVDQMLNATLPLIQNQSKGFQLLGQLLENMSQMQQQQQKTCGQNCSQMLVSPSSSSSSAHHPSQYHTGSLTPHSGM